MAQANTVRLNESSHQALRQLADATGESMQAVLAKAIEEYRRKQFFEQLDESFAALRCDATSLQEETAERDSLAGTLSDGLDADEVWTEDGKLIAGA